MSKGSSQTGISPYLKVGAIAIITVLVVGGGTAMTHPFFNPWYMGWSTFLTYMSVITVLALLCVAILTHFDDDAMGGAE